MDASSIARSVPSPGKLADRPSPETEPDGDEEADYDKASMGAEIMSAGGMKGGDPVEFCEALERYLDAAGYKRS